jgi:hypothetical protein
VRWRSAIIVCFITTIAGGCGGVETLVPRPADRCELHVLRREGFFIEEIAAPYVVEIVRPEAAAAPVSITFAGLGWRQVDVVIIAPDGKVESFRGDGRDLEVTEFAELPIRAPGEWRFRLTDLLAGCLRDITVDARLGP